MRARLAFPLRAENGRLALVTGERATLESILQYPLTRPGERVLSRALGMNLEYNVTLDGALDAVDDLNEQIHRYEPTGVGGTATATFDPDEFTLRATVVYHETPVIEIVR